MMLWHDIPYIGSASFALDWDATYWDTFYVFGHSANDTQS